MRFSEIFHPAKEPEKPVKPERPAKVEQMESGNYKITTASGSNYILEKMADGKWQIDFKGEVQSVVGFATLPVFPEQFAYQPPEAREGYEIKAEPEANLYVLFADKNKEDESKSTFGHTSKIATIAKIND